MIADLADDKLRIRLITKNVMSVYSTDSEYTDFFIRKLKHSNYIVDGKTVSSSDIISYIKKDYNVYENIGRYISRHKEYRYSKFVEYISYFNICRSLWMNFSQLDDYTLSLVEIAMQLSSSKPIIIIGYIDDKECRKKMYSLLFSVGLEDRLIIIPFKDIDEAVNNSTCQCYVKSENAAKILPMFSNEFINHEFKTDHVYYNGMRPLVYVNNEVQMQPTKYQYSLYELFMIFIYNIKYTLILLYNWSNRLCL